MKPNRLPRGLIMLLVFLVVFLTCGLSHQGHTALMTGMILPHIFPGAPARPLEWITPAPVVHEVSYRSGQTEITGDLYRPGDDGKHGAFVLLLGVNPVERNQPELVEFCKGLARAGLVVLVHDPPELRKGNILPEEKDNLIAAFNYLQAQPFVDPQRVGMLGFSVGASLEVVAAEDERLRDRVAVINFFGGYYDILDVLRATTTRQISYMGQTQAWEPSDLTVAIFVKQMLETVSDPHDYALVSNALVNKVTLSQAEYASLGSEGRLVYDLFTTHDLQKVDQLIAQLPPSLLDRLRAVSPSTHIDQLKTHMLIMHDVGDHYIPYVESRRLADALPAGQYHYTEFSIFQHVMVNTNTNWLTLLPDAVRLYYHVFLLLNCVM